MPEVKVNPGKRSYPIVIGSQIDAKLPTRLRRLVGGGRLFVFYDANFYALHGAKLQKSLAKTFTTVEFVLPSGERYKSQRHLGRIHDFLLSEKISRTDFILACGGGVTSDLVGFAASSTLRGIRWGVVSTTLLGMVDAAIGGKTGINHVMGKNLIGAYWQPSIVWCDTTYLMTLTEREIVCGLGEVLKYGGLLGKPMLDLLHDYRNSGDSYNQKRLQRIISLSAKYKAQIVSADETEKGKRMVLNFGHTFSHAIESAIGFGKLTHGEALIIGLKAAIELSKRVYSGQIKALVRYDEIVTDFLHSVRRRKIAADDVMLAMQIDKKRRGHAAKFILLEKPGRPIIAEGINRDLVNKSLISALEVYRLFGGRNA